MYVCMQCECVLYTYIKRLVGEAWLVQYRMCPHYRMCSVSTASWRSLVGRLLDALENRMCSHTIECLLYVFYTVCSTCSHNRLCTPQAWKLPSSADYFMSCRKAPIVRVWQVLYTHTHTNAHTYYIYICTYFIYIYVHTLTHSRTHAHTHTHIIHGNIYRYMYNT
jgi:hypothetical protein